MDYSDSQLRLTPDSFFLDAVECENLLDSGESVRSKYYLLDSPENGDQYYPLGTYRYEQDVEISCSENPELIEFTWGFELSVTTEDKTP